MKKVFALFFGLMMILATFTASPAEARRHHRNNPHSYNQYNNQYNYGYGRRHHYPRNHHRRPHNRRNHRKIWRDIWFYSQLVRGYGPYNNGEYRPRYHHGRHCHRGQCSNRYQQCDWQYLPHMGGWYFICN